MYYICKFSDTWTLYDGSKQASRALERAEIDGLKDLFPGLLADKGKILIALQITAIQPNKLVQLSVLEKNVNGKKNLEPAGKEKTQ